ncbi:hypothetical protein N431DRAFT_455752 [Stipitochalara longipes BDJ]|nr:hypothetical protein N431DRAFT_455752 [Stipitochalara longipes BDJ]
MHIKGSTLVLAALLAGASAAPQPVAKNAALAARTAVLSTTRADGLDKRQFGCTTDPSSGDQICIYCMIFGEDYCCTTTDITTGQTLDDGCDYFGGKKSGEPAIIVILEDIRLGEEGRCTCKGT